MQRQTAFVPGEWYHCYSRGVDKRVIFTERADYDRFMMLLYAANSTPAIQVSSVAKNQGPTLELVLNEERTEPPVDIGAYCLKPNHYHLLLRERVEGGITSFMRRIGTGYTMYFNLKNDRTGALFSGKFKSSHISNDEYLRRILTYIHGNAAELVEPDWKQGLIENEQKTRQFLRTYPYSSIPEYEGIKRMEAKIVNKEAVRDVVSTMPTIDSVLSDQRDFGANRNLFQGPTLEW